MAVLLPTIFVPFPKVHGLSMGGVLTPVVTSMAVRPSPYLVLSSFFKSWSSRPLTDCPHHQSMEAQQQDLIEVVQVELVKVAVASWPRSSAS